MQTSELSLVNRLEEPWLKESPKYQELVKLAFRYKNAIHEQPLMHGYYTTPRAPVKVLEKVDVNDQLRGNKIVAGTCGEKKIEQQVAKEKN